MILVLCADIAYLASQNSALTSTNEEQRENVSQLELRLNETTRNLTHTRFELSALENDTAQLLTSNITPPVSKLRAVEIALTQGGWNSSSLRGLEVTATLNYVRIWRSNSGSSSGFEQLHSVSEPVDDYSPRVEYNVTEPWGGVYKGTLWYRYVWTITVTQIEGVRSIPPPGEYWVDAGSGELFAYEGLGFTQVK